MTIGFIYKICPRRAWQAALSTGAYEGSADDRRDGFIHFSTSGQLAGTLQKHFAGQTDLVLLQVDPAGLGDALQWEPSRDGALFPHLYGQLAVGAVGAQYDLPVAQDGRHMIPEGLE